MVIFSEKKSYLVALIVPNLVEVEKKMKKEGTKYDNLDAYLNSQQFKEMLLKEIKKQSLRNNLRNEEIVKDFKIIIEHFTEEKGTLSLNQKLIRINIMKQFEEQIKQLSS